MNTFTRLASAAVLGLALNAAYGEEAPKTVTVQFADLDLSKDAGLAMLFDRMKGAATRVCSGHRGGTALRDTQQYAACVDFALSNAVARVDRPREDVIAPGGPPARAGNCATIEKNKRQAIRGKSIKPLYITSIGIDLDIARGTRVCRGRNLAVASGDEIV